MFQKQSLNLDVNTAFMLYRIICNVRASLKFSKNNPSVRVSVKFHLMFVIIIFVRFGLLSGHL